VGGTVSDADPSFPEDEPPEQLESTSVNATAADSPSRCNDRCRPMWTRRAGREFEEWGIGLETTGIASTVPCNEPLRAHLESTP